MMLSRCSVRATTSFAPGELVDREGLDRPSGARCESDSRRRRTVARDEGGRGVHLRQFPLPGTMGVPGRYTGTYGELRGDWTVTAHYAVAFDAVHYAIGTAIRQEGGHDANYLSVQVSYGW